MLRIRSVSPLNGRRLRLTLTDGSIVERDVQDLLWGPVFESIRSDDARFRRVRARHGAVTWPGHVDLAPETLHPCPALQTLAAVRALVARRAGGAGLTDAAERSQHTLATCGAQLPALARQTSRALSASRACVTF